MATAFDNLAPRIVGDLKREFGLTDVQAAGIVGNLAYESAGFTAYQEKSPVGGGRGGAGWAQWTGPRRVSFESYCKRKSLVPTSYDANFGFLCVELESSYQHAIEQVKKTSTVKAATETFEATFERAGVKNMPGRIKYAERALALYRASPGVQPMPTPVPAPIDAPEPKSWYQSKTVWGAVLAVALPLIGIVFPAARLVDPNTAADFVLHVIAVGGPIIGGIIALFGRLSVTQPIAGTKAAQVVDARYEAALNTPSADQVGQADAAPQQFGSFPFPSFPDLGSLLDPAAEPNQPASPQAYVGFGQILSVLSQAFPYALMAIRFANAHPELRVAVTTLIEGLRQALQQAQATRAANGPQA